MKLMLVDDHALFLEGLRYLLETHGMHVIGTAKNGKEALKKALILKPDIILMDIRMPECSGLDALKLIKAQMPEIKVVMLTTSGEDEDLFEAVKYGASGYLLKNTDAKELIEMLKSLEKGEGILSPGLAAKLFQEFRRNSTESTESQQSASQESDKKELTDRQVEILDLIAKGRTYKQAGELLAISERTVKYHMGRILELLHLENRAQVIAYAAHVGIIERQEISD